MNADAVLMGGADESDEPGRIFSYLNLNRAFLELLAGAELYCLHKNRWWQTTVGPRLDSGALVAGLEYAAGIEAIVLGKPSPAYFGAAIEAIDADAEMTWMVGDDIDGDIVGAQGVGMRTVLVRTGSSGPTSSSRRAATRRHRLLRSPISWIARGERMTPLRVGVDLIEIDRVRRALERHGDGFRARCFTEAERAYCESKRNPAQHYAGHFAAKEAGREGARLGACYFTWREIEVRGAPPSPACS